MTVHFKIVPIPTFMLSKAETEIALYFKNWQSSSETSSLYQNFNSTPPAMLAPCRETLDISYFFIVIQSNNFSDKFLIRVWCLIITERNLICRREKRVVCLCRKSTTTIYDKCSFSYIFSPRTIPFFAMAGAQWEVYANKIAT